MNFTADLLDVIQRIGDLVFETLFLPVLKLLGLISPKLAETLTSSHVLFSIVWIVILVAVIFLFNTLIILFQRSKGEKGAQKDDRKFGS